MSVTLLILCIASSVLIGTLAGSYKPTDIQNPMSGAEAVKFCGRPDVPRSAICDPDNLMSKDAKDAIEGFINMAKGAEVGVVVIERMASSFVLFSSYETAAEKFARTVHNSWGVGEKDSQNGVLVFLSIKDRTFFISRGEGVAKQLTDRHIDRVMEHVKPMLRVNDVGRAVESIVVEIDLITSDQEKAKTYFTASHSSGSNVSDSAASMKDEGSTTGGFVVIGIVFAVVGFISYRNTKERQELEKGKKALDKLMKEVNNIKEGNKFQCESCPICMDDFPLKVAEGRLEDASNLALSTMESSSSIDAGDTSTTRSSHNFGADVTEEKNDKKRPMALQCGHVFCYECLETHLNTSNGRRCPICRENVDGTSSPATAAGAASATAAPPTGGNGTRGPRTSTPITSSNDAPSSSSSPSCSNTGRVLRRPPSFWYRHHTPELLYRMNRMRYLYPRVMTDVSHAALTNAINNQSFAEFNVAAEQRLLQVTERLTKMREAAKSSGKNGSSRSSFGGGRSSGGRGGRW